MAHGQAQSHVLLSENRRGPFVQAITRLRHVMENVSQHTTPTSASDQKLHHDSSTLQSWVMSGSSSGPDA